MKSLGWLPPHCPEDGRELPNVSANALLQYRPQGFMENSNHHTKQCQCSSAIMTSRFYWKVLIINHCCCRHNHKNKTSWTCCFWHDKEKTWWCPNNHTQIYIPDGLGGFMDALSDPRAFLSAQVHLTKNSCQYFDEWQVKDAKWQDTMASGM